MKTALTVFAVIAWLFPLSATPAVAEVGTVGDCIMGCLPGPNDCTAACEAAFPQADKSCMATCQNTFTQCVEPCQSKTLTYKSCQYNCNENFLSCMFDCDEYMGSFNAPNWVPPLSCPFSCQGWNPLTQTCGGPPVNDCN